MDNVAKAAETSSVSRNYGTMFAYILADNTTAEG